MVTKQRHRGCESDRSLVPSLSDPTSTTTFQEETLGATAGSSRFDSEDDGIVWPLQRCREVGRNHLPGGCKPLVTKAFFATGTVTA